ncbi:MAG: hypothetical protein ACI87W_003024 [Halieaceae bacterium]|jgi:hypothetical protein
MNVAWLFTNRSLRRSPTRKSPSSRMEAMMGMRLAFKGELHGKAGYLLNGHRPLTVEQYLGALREHETDVVLLRN